MNDGGGGLFAVIGPGGTLTKPPILYARPIENSLIFVSSLKTLTYNQFCCKSIYFRYLQQGILNMINMIIYGYDRARIFVDTAICIMDWSSSEHCKACH